MFYELEPGAFPKGAQFFFNILVVVIALPAKSTDFLSLDIEKYWYLGALTEPNPYAFLFFRDPSISNPTITYQYELIPHCAIEITPQQEVYWYEMVDYDTEDLWDPTPILEDFDYNEEDE